MNALLIMVTGMAFYPIESVPDVPLAKQARDNGILNLHVIRVEDLDGNILWDRINENALS